MTVTLSQEQLPGSPHSALGHFGAAPDLPREESREGETKGRKREGSKCLVEHFGWEAWLAWPCPMPINAVWPVLSFGSVLLGERAHTRLI